MKLQRFLPYTTILFILTACEPAVPAVPTATPVSAASPAPENQTPAGGGNIQVEPEAMLYEQDFESKSLTGLSILSGEWIVRADDEGNGMLCNTTTDDYSTIRFGSGWWANYAFELRVTAVEAGRDSNMTIFTRMNDDFESYYGAYNFDNGQAALAFNEPYQSLGQGYLPPEENTWYRLRLDNHGSLIEFFIDQDRIATGPAARQFAGLAAFSVSPNLEACVDDIRVWALTATGEMDRVPGTIVPALEVVTNQAATGDGGNPWGGHQSRIVRTGEGIFSAYTVDGSGNLDRKWRLARRQEDGGWKVIAAGDAGKDPVHLLASPDGTLHVIGWPNATGTMWTGRPAGNQVEMTKETIPGVARDNWPYSSAGIDAAGNLCVLSTQGGRPGIFQWACYLPGPGHWVSRSTSTDYGFRYTYVFPNPDGGLYLVSTRDVLWSALGYTQPPGTFDYVFNAVGFWRTDDLETQPLERLFLMEEAPTDEYPEVRLNAQEDVYLDTEGNLHILYHIQGPSLGGRWQNRHAVLAPDGGSLADVRIPDELGIYVRIFQDSAGNFYLLGSEGLLFPAGDDGLSLGLPTVIDLQGYTVEYSGYAISAPRTGTPMSDVLEVVFPSGNEKLWVYFQLPLTGDR
jgi:hypothetical protein